MGWAVEKFTLIPGSSSLKAKCAIRTSWGLIPDFKVFQVSGKDPFVRPPQDPFTDKEGKTKYKSHVIFDIEGKGAEVWALISKAILDKYSKEIGGSSSGGSNATAQTATQPKPVSSPVPSKPAAKQRDLEKEVHDELNDINLVDDDSWLDNL